MKLEEGLKRAGSYILSGGAHYRAPENMALPTGAEKLYRELLQDKTACEVISSAFFSNLTRTTDRLVAALKKVGAFRTEVEARTCLESIGGEEIVLPLGDKHHNGRDISTYVTLLRLVADHVSGGVWGITLRHTPIKTQDTSETYSYP